MNTNSRIKYIAFWCLFVALPCLTYNSVAQTTNTVKQYFSEEGNKLIEQLSSDTIYLGNNNQLKKQEVTGAIDKVSGKELQKTNSFNPANSLYGLLPGLTVLQNQGVTGSRNPSIFIRGLNTLNNNVPLVLVDGVETDITYLNTLSIESVEVLKDAAALAIYGQRGANGVLLVTTKTGIKQKMDVNIWFENGLTSATQLPDFLNAGDYANAVNTARKYDGLQPLYSAVDIQGYRNGGSNDFYPNVDWLGETLRSTGTKTNFNASFRGGSDKLLYYAALGYQAEDGLFDDKGMEPYATNVKYDRVNFRTNLDVDLTPTTLLKMGVFGAIDELYTPGSGAGAVMNAIYNTPSNAFPVINSNGNWGGTNIYGNNPVAMVNSTGYSKDQGTIIGVNGLLNQNLDGILKGLSAELSIGHNNRATSFDGQRKSYRYEDLDYNEMTMDTISQIFDEDSNLEPYSGNGYTAKFTRFYGKVKYDRQTDTHSFNTFAMYSQEKFVGRGQYTTFLRQNIAGNFHYDFKDKYIAEVTLSYAGSSVLPEDRFEFYPAVSAGWVISEEDFVKNDGWLQYLKLRGSFGYAGSDRIVLNTEDQSYSGVGGYNFTANNNTQWSVGEGRLAGNPKMEKAMMGNIGLDLNLFKKLNLVVDGFYNKRTNILVSTDGQLTSLIGVAPPILPNGEVSNRGVEATLTWQDNIKDFNYSATGMFSYAKNTIEEMGEVQRPYDYLERTGNSIGQAFGLVTDGFFDSQEEIDNSNQQLFSTVSPGDVKYVDQNGDNLIDEFDEVALGHSTRIPEIYYSFNLHAEYKGIGVNAIFQGTANHTVYLNTQNVYRPLINNNNITSFSNNTWTENNMDTATLPRLTTLDNDNNYRSNDIWLKDGDYLKLRTLEVYYAIPTGVTKKFGIEYSRLFFRGTNLASWDSLDQLDPEALSNSYPLLKTMSLGLEFTF
ncbi:SusC/RagA family TonB-linked outer membrane protein [Galbibacter mesophilus]|uniref:SusC/RagA family TonB-linked outer membrane protein n=1 Tax=Galbibacter mesophilus TaxID=379069 RepID=UPI00191D12AF|nr:SusC/RagA family TonB-linked outer membrane protein [Galbibacter mesophilus]MCM5664044.1 SusC/RagA family TonB-linked outer membrane protein [Galbibacter mesophilus]